MCISSINRICDNFGRVARCNHFSLCMFSLFILQIDRFKSNNKIVEYKTKFQQKQKLVDKTNDHNTY